MKRTLTALCIIFLLALGGQSLFAQILMQEDFNYSLNTLLTVDNARWALTGTTTSNPEQISDSNLALSGAGGLVYPSTGKALVLKRTGQDVNYRFVNTEADSITASTGSGVVYASFLVNVDTVETMPTINAIGDYFFHLGDYGGGAAAVGTSINTADFWARIYVRKANTSDSALTFGIARGALVSTGLPQFTDSIYQRHTTYLLVVKYDFGGAPLDTTLHGAGNASLYVFGAGDDWSTEPGSPNAQAYDQGAAPQFSTGLSVAHELSFVCLRQGSTATAPYLVIDGIHVSQSWSDLALPVELTAFTAGVKGQSVDLAWSTATEVNNSGFAVERKAANGTYSQVGFVTGNGTSNAPHHYSYTDAVGAGTYTYRLKQVDHDGKFAYSKQVEAVVGLTPADYVLGQNYPNPFNPTTTISFAVKADQKATLKVYNMMGQEVMTLFNGDAKADQLYHVQFNAATLSSGTYFYTLQTNDSRQVKKMLLLK
ncbi:MAG TPA: T9SS type A sorting domain-containing protein [Bacteroidota bacterium]|nr:T9SS type A sorting domain-containing protein [Bacteroidota bacterium]